MASRNGFRALGFLALLGGLVLGGCATSAESPAEDTGVTPAATASTQFSPEPLAAEIASTGGNGTAVSFPDSTPPTYKPATESADRGEIYGSPAYTHYGDNTPVHINLAELPSHSGTHVGNPEAGEAAAPSATHE